MLKQLWLGPCRRLSCQLALLPSRFEKCCVCEGVYKFVHHQFQRKVTNNHPTRLLSSRRALNRFVVFETAIEIPHYVFTGPMKFSEHNAFIYKCSNYHCGLPGLVWGFCNAFAQTCNGGIWIPSYPTMSGVRCIPTSTSKQEQSWNMFLFFIERFLDGQEGFLSGKLAIFVSIASSSRLLRCTFMFPFTLKMVMTCFLFHVIFCTFESLFLQGHHLFTVWAWHLVSQFPFGGFFGFWALFESFEFLVKAKNWSSKVLPATSQTGNILPTFFLFLSYLSSSDKLRRSPKNRFGVDIHNLCFPQEQRSSTVIPYTGIVSNIILALHELKPFDEGVVAEHEWNGKMFLLAWIPSCSNHLMNVAPRIMCTTTYSTSLRYVWNYRSFTAVEKLLTSITCVIFLKQTSALTSVLFELPFARENECRSNWQDSVIPKGLPDIFLQAEKML